MKVKLKNVRPNPFRNIDAYPTNTDKVEQLKKSIQSTEFWDNIVARKSGNGIEIAYGHHRLRALNELYDGEETFSFIIRDLDDSEMIKIMAHENLDEWGHNSGTERETVRAVINAYGAGQIFLNAPAKKTSNNQLRFADAEQQFCFHASGSEPHAHRPYTADTVSAFLGGTMTIDTIKYTLRALCLIEQGHLDEEKLRDVSSHGARVVVNEVVRAVKQAEAMKAEGEREALKAATPTMEKIIRKQAKKNANALVSNTASAASHGIKDGASAAKEAALRARLQAKGQKEQDTEIDDFANKVSTELMRYLEPGSKTREKLDAIIKHKKHLSRSPQNSLEKALDRIIEHAEGLKNQLSK